ncbi:MAG: DUF1573 domain-containing protein [Chitinophagaceae bacterium]|nr:DUF1573 domain-containing protein [Chitinophagaceae bacterium]
MNSIFVSISFFIASITILNNDINIGNILVGEKRLVTFKIRNNSKRPIKIYSVTSTCGCTIPAFPKELKAESITDITAHFDSKGILGTIRKDLVLVIDDEKKFYKLSFSAKCIK